MIIHFIRAIYLLVVLAFTMSYASQYAVYLKGTQYVTFYILIPVLGAFALVMVDMFWHRKRLQVLSGLFFGLLAGMVIAYVMGQVVDLVGDVFSTITSRRWSSNSKSRSLTSFNLPPRIWIALVVRLISASINPIFCAIAMPPTRQNGKVSSIAVGSLARPRETTMSTISRY